MKWEDFRPNWDENISHAETSNVAYYKLYYIINL